MNKKTGDFIRKKGRHSIRSIFTLMVGGIFTVFIAVVGLILWMMISRAWQKQSDDYTEQLTKHYMSEVIAIMQNTYDTTKALASSYATYEKIEPVNRRQYFLQLQKKKYLKRTKAILMCGR